MNAPKQDEIWIHSFRGRVRIVRAWNDRESICQFTADDHLPAKQRRTMILANLLMKPERAQ